MQTKAYKKSIIREILSSKARFASILVIIFLGVSFFAGIKSSGPDIKHSVNELYKEKIFMDGKIVSTLGLTSNDLKLLENDNEILDFYGTYSIDANLTNMNSVVKFLEFNPKKNNINKFIEVEGRLPEKSGEIALDAKLLNSETNFKIGDEYKIECDKDTLNSFKTDTYTIVGFVKNPMFIEKESRGSTTIGKGSIDYFAVLNTDDISMDVYTEIYVRFKNVQDLNTYSDEYKNKMEENIKHLEDLYSERPVDRVEEIKSEAKVELDKAYKEIEDGENELLKAEKELEDGEKQIEEGSTQYKKGLLEYNKKISDGEKQISDAEAKLNIAQSQINTEKLNIENGEKQLNAAKVDLDKAKDKFVNQGINPDSDISVYKNQINNLKSLSNSYESLSKDINNSSNNISNEKIEEWKRIISQPGLGLEGLRDLVNTLDINKNNDETIKSIVGTIESINSSVKTNITKLETLVSGLDKYQSGKLQYEEQVKRLNDGKLQIENAQKQINDSKKQISSSKTELQNGKIEGKEKLEKARLELEEATRKIVDGRKEIEENKQKLVDARAEVDSELEKLNTLENSKYYFFDRNDTVGYSGVKDAIQSLDNIASVFPVFFFLVAVLICLTTMTRMVEEKRIEIGTLKALGYNDLEIAMKFIVYAALASISGAILGILIGCSGLPKIIGSAYGTLYDLPELSIIFYPSYIIQSMGISILCTVGASLFILKVELKSNPSSMMRPKAPKIGKKILLERIKPLWRRLNFNQKVTLRNLFRYKQRMLMTVFGIAGCMAMLITGFALQNSNAEVLSRQFDKLWKYDALVVFDKEFSYKDREKYIETLKGIRGYEESLNIYQEAITFSKENMNKQTVTMYVPENIEEFNKYILLNNRETGEEFNINNYGVIVSEKLAKMLGVTIGDTITFKDANNDSYEVRIEKIAENYFMHSIFMSPSYYENIFGKDIKYNSQFVNLDSNTQDEQEIATKLMECDNVINVTLASNMVNSSMDTTENMNVIMLVIILASGSLAFVVLYNLNNINVSERIRELSTIKVLGFYDNEVTMYIFRENIILTLLGVLAGSALGKLLYTFIINTAETDNMMMIPNVYFNSYAISAIITIFFSLLVMIFMHIKLKNVNMIDALKSNE